MKEWIKTIKNYDPDKYIIRYHGFSYKKLTEEDVKKLLNNGNN